MKELDKVSLLFEMLFESDLIAVNRKIYEIKMSKEYNRVSEAIVALSLTDPMNEIVQRYNKLDVEGILSYDRALEVQKEIKLIDEQINFIKNFNPYLSCSDNVKEYGIKTVGDINVEISAKNQKVNDFTTNSGVSVTHRRKIMAIKVFSWYKEAKKQIYLLIENSKLFLSRIRHSKVRYKSLSFQFLLMSLFTLFTIFAVSYAGRYYTFRLGKLPLTYQAIGTVSMYVMCLSLGLFMIIRAHYYYYGYRSAAKMRDHVAKQEHIIKQLDETSIKFERDLANRIKKPRKVNTTVESIGILGDDNNFSFNEVFDYMYNEKEFYYSKYKFILKVANALFALCLIASTIVLVLPLILNIVQ